MILLATIYLAWRGLKAPAEAGALGNLAELEETLKKLLEKAAIVPHAADGQSGGAPQELLAEIDVLKKGLEERQVEIENLKNSNATKALAGSEQAGLSDAERGKLEAQLKELQGKLSEYEIISEDIADLSFYKEENAKLQKLLESAKAAGGAAAAGLTKPPPPPPPESSSAAVEAAPAVTVVADSAPESVPVLSQVQESAPTAEVKLGVDDDLMAEFAAAVESQKSASAEPIVVVSDTDLGEMNMDKMMAEAEGIGTATISDEPENALDATLNEEKLLQEASELQVVKAEDKELMNEFENFVKKGS